MPWPACSYQISITNESQDTVKLMERYWHITNGWVGQAGRLGIQADGQVAGAYLFQTWSSKLVYCCAECACLMCWLAPPQQLPPTAGPFPCCLPCRQGQSQEVRGPGVVGEQPELAPGETFQYQSACPLPTPRGKMKGHFEFYARDEETRQWNRSFLVNIGTFELRSDV